MSHCIGKKETVGAALLRLVDDDLAGARAELAASGRREERIHRARRRLKRTRTLLRVLEPEFGEAAIAARRSLGAAARLLSRARDADVAAASARGLAAERADVGLDKVVESLDQAATRAHLEKTPSGKVKRQLASVAADVAGFRAGFDGAALLNRALARVYGRGRKAMRRSETTLAMPEIHRWRKEVKHLWHLTQLARKRLPRDSRGLAEGLERLGEILGLDHDHAMLARKLALSPPGNPSLMRQLSLIARRRRALEADAFALGADIYGKTPKAFARRFHVGR